ncbi:MAG: YihY/virulence factor BrkB family protein [Oscillospiraceae bacterium]|nr:YihY/virulence factor BrkB family protein [Oscillospiraceae bacterium]
MKARHILRRAWQFLTDAGKKFAADHLSAYAAQATFYLMLAVFPFTMLVCMASRMLPFLNEDTLLKLVRLLVPESYRALGVDLIDGYYNENIGSAKFVLIIFLIWTASRLIQALMNGFNTSYGLRESRSQTLLRLIGCLYTIALCVMFVTLIVMYALGSRLIALILEHAPDFVLLELILKLTRNLATPLLLLLVFWLSYVILPSRKTKFRYEFPGALLTAVVWRCAAELYAIFLSRSLDRYNYVYGTLGGVVMMLIWLYTCVYVWFIGAELNGYIRRRAEAGDFDKYHISLPAIFKRRRKQPQTTEQSVRESA